MITLRPVTHEDCTLLFKWANDSKVRENSFSPNSIDLESHIKWYKHKINDKKTNIFIVLKDNVEVGQIRVDIENDKGFIDYSIDENNRGQGIGAEILQLIKMEITNVNLIGYVKKENIASIKAFKKTGYEKIEHDDFIEFVYKSNFNEVNDEKNRNKS